MQLWRFSLVLTNKFIRVNCVQFSKTVHPSSVSDIFHIFNNKNGAKKSTLIATNIYKPLGRKQYTDSKSRFGGISFWFRNTKKKKQKNKKWPKNAGFFDIIKYSNLCHDRIFG